MGIKTKNQSKNQKSNTSKKKTRRLKDLAPGEEKAIKDKTETITILNKTLLQMKTEVKRKEKEIKEGQKLIEKEKANIKLIKNEGLHVYHKQLEKESQKRQKKQTQKDNQWIKDHPKEYAAYLKKTPIGRYN